MTLNLVKKPNFMPKRQDSSSAIVSTRYSAFLGYEPSRWSKRWFLGLRDFREIREFNSRNSYRCLKCHIYETVKLNQIELSNQINYSESEKRYKAFIEHDLV